MKDFFKFLASFLQEENGKSSQKRIIVFIAMFLIALITYADLFYDKTVDYMLLASLLVIILFGIGMITKLSESTLNKIIDYKDNNKNNELDKAK